MRKKNKVVWHEEEGHIDEGGRKQRYGLKAKMLRKVEGVRGECKELLLYYVGKFNNFFCLAGRMPVRFSG